MRRDSSTALAQTWAIDTNVAGQDRRARALAAALRRLDARRGKSYTRVVKSFIISRNSIP